MDPNLYLEVLRKQAQVWTDLMEAVEDMWSRSFSFDWVVEARVSEEEVLGDLAYGRD
jgi:hypothetical protein